MKIVPIPCSFDNYSYLLICSHTRQAAVIDPTEAYPVAAQVDREGVTLTTVLCTHHHHDHIGDIGALQERFTSLRVICYSGDKNRIGAANTTVDHGDSVEVGELQGTVLFTPGHTSGSICYRFGEHVFTGDTLFGAGCGRLFEGTPEQMYESLNSTLGSLPEQTRVYFGHEYTRKNLNFAKMVEPDNKATAKLVDSLSAGTSPTTPTTLQQEKEVNPFLRCDSPSIIEYLTSQGETGLSDPVRVFSQLRKRRNSF